MTYNDLMSMPLTDLEEWFAVANKISKEQKQAVDSVKGRR